MPREISLYFGGIESRDARLLIKAWVEFFARDPKPARLSFEETVRRDLPAHTVRLFSSARGALTAALRAAAVRPGDEVVLAGFTCSAVPIAVRTAGANPVYADIDADSLCMRADSVERALSPRTRAIVIQHTFGAAADVELVAALAQRHDLLLIEDCALAVGSRHEGQLVGSFGDAAIFSLELSKTITTGWGGVLIARGPALGDAIAALYATVPEPPRSWVTCAAWQTALCAVAYDPALFPLMKYLVAGLYKLGVFRPSAVDEDEAAGVGTAGFVRRMGAPQATLGATLWRRLPDTKARMRMASERLAGVLRDNGVQPLGPGADREVGALSPRVSWLDGDRERAAAWFRTRRIELGSWFDAPVSPLPANPELLGYHFGNCPVGEAIAAQIVNLPVHARLRDEDISHMVNALQQYLAGTAARPAGELRAARSPTHQVGQ